ncbi:cell separation during budding [Cladochytrium tenue]|nr:cell separation during budding [Cladochytrium tenue]
MSSSSSAAVLPPSPELHAALEAVTCGNLVHAISKGSAGSAADAARPKVPICLDVELTVQEGCAALAQYKISSAPVYSPEAGGFIGMLDYRDLVAYVLEVFHKVPKEQQTFDAEMVRCCLQAIAFADNDLLTIIRLYGATKTLQEVSDIVKRATMDRQSVPIRLVTNLSRRNPLVAVYANSTLSSAVEQFVANRVHRVVVLDAPDPTSDDPKSKFVGVLSQSAVAAVVVDRFGRLHAANAAAAASRAAATGGGVPTSPSSPSPPRPSAHAHHTGGASGPSAWAAGSRSLAELGLVRGEVYSVAPNDTVLDALYIMHEKSVSSVAIVDRAVGGSRLAGSISMTDIKEILSSRGGWRRLYEPCFRFFAALRSQQGLEARAGADRVPSFTVHPSSALLAALEKMVATRTHRVWIVADGAANHADGDVVGVLSLSDVMPIILEAIGGPAVAAVAAGSEGVDAPPPPPPEPSAPEASAS